MFGRKCILAGLMTVAMFVQAQVISPAVTPANDQLEPKVGGVAFRFDDNKKAEEWLQLAAVFDKHGCKMGVAINSSLRLDAEQVKVLQEMAKNGHIIMDHTPSHAMFSVNFSNPADFEKYSKDPAVHHAEPQHRRIFLKYVLKTDWPNNKPFVGKIVNDELVEYPAELKGRLGFTSKFYHVDTKTVYGIRLSGDKKMVFDLWGQKANVAELSGDFIGLFDYRSIAPTDETLRLVATISRDKFAAMGLPAPKVWLQPGGWETFITAEDLAQIYGKEFGYVAADCIPATNSNQVGCFNDPMPERGRFTMKADFTGPDNGQDFPAMKRNIADSFAKNKTVFFISHMWVQRVKGGMKAYLEGYDELLGWLKQNNIPVRTMEEWSTVIYDKKPVADTNIMPPLTKDLDGNGVPDGYALQKGATADLATGVVTIPVGGKLHSSDIAGVEKGMVKVSLQAKAAPGTNVIVDYFFVMRNGKNYVIRKQFGGFANDQWKKLEAEIEVKPEAVTLHFGVSFSQSNTPIQVKEPVFKK